MDLNNFQTDVLDRSYDLPVVVDFWAEWCGPCRMLGPTIEALAAEQAGRWELVKVDTEAFPEIAARYQIRSIPNVKLFRNGQVVDEFMGAQARSFIEKWLDKNIPSEEALQLEALLEQAPQLPAEVYLERLRQLHETQPESPQLRLEFAKALLWQSPAEAEQLTTGFGILDEGYDTAQDIQTLAAFLSADLTDDTPVGQKLQHARQALLRQQAETGIQLIIEATTLDKSYREDLPRKVAIALFRIWGDQNELNKKYRWRFDMALY